MLASYEEVDFLIVTTLSAETDAVRELLEEEKPLTHYIVGKISREGSNDRYVVALTEIGEMGTNAAQAAVGEALNRLNPKRVILTGIAAGFPEAGVNLGDILIPNAIVPYELTKIKEPSAGRWKTCWRWLFNLLRFQSQQKKVEYEHRAFPAPVSYQLWHAAKTLGSNGTCPWAQEIKEPRPDGTNKKPVAHTNSLSVLGSGDKIVASKFAEVRKWLLEEFPHKAIGLEMESYGVQKACQVREIPFLVVKASQDPATQEKDVLGKKDLWRVYAAEAAAAFTIALIRRFELQEESDLLSQHRQEVIRIAQNFERDIPKPSFTYKVSRSRSYAFLKEGVYDLRSQELSVLIPDAATPAIALHGGGGTGKTRIIKSLISRLIDAELCPVLVDLRRYSIECEGWQERGGLGSLIRDILLAGSIPRRTARELERLTKKARLVVLIDGLNEVPREARTILVDYFQGLRREGTCYLLVTDRFGPWEFSGTFSHAAVDKLDLNAVKAVFDSEFGAGSFEQLAERLRRIYQRPFFLSLALGTRRKFEGKHMWTGIFEEFFRGQLRMTPENLDKAAKATVDAFDKDGRFNLDKFKQTVNGNIYQALVEAEVLGREGKGFEHHLWRDYLASRYLAQDKDAWKNSVFDVLTTFSSSLECLSLTVEQLADQGLKDTFLKMVFDWNYSAAADCIADFREDEPEPRQLSPSIRSAILVAVAEKRFDAVQRTRQRANEILRDHRYQLARPFIEAKSREALMKHVIRLSGPGDWFRQWKALFTKGNGERLGTEEINLIASNDSLIGWATANLARRSILDKEGQQRVRDIYREVGKSENTESVRWRVVHVLGAYSDASNVALLLKAAMYDPYHWVQYGAVRALIEIASQSGKELRELALEGLAEFIKSYSSTKLWMRRQIFGEIIEAAFIRNPKPGWKEAVEPILTLVVQSETDPSYQKVLSDRLSDFKSYNENG